MAHLNGIERGWFTGQSYHRIDGVPTYCAEAAVCGGTGNHDGQDVDTCDECDPNHPEQTRTEEDERT